MLNQTSQFHPATQKKGQSALFVLKRGVRPERNERKTGQSALFVPNEAVKRSDPFFGPETVKRSDPFSGLTRFPGRRRIGATGFPNWNDSHAALLTRPSRNQRIGGRSRLLQRNTAAE
jgi:hypothetical protein